MCSSPASFQVNLKEEGKWCISCAEIDYFYMVMVWNSLPGSRENFLVCLCCWLLHSVKTCLLSRLNHYWSSFFPFLCACPFSSLSVYEFIIPYSNTWTSPSEFPFQCFPDLSVRAVEEPMRASMLCFCTLRKGLCSATPELLCWGSGWIGGAVPGLLMLDSSDSSISTF